MLTVRAPVSPSAHTICAGATVTDTAGTTSSGLVNSPWAGSTP